MEFWVLQIAYTDLFVWHLEGVQPYDEFIDNALEDETFTSKVCYQKKEQAEVAMKKVKDLLEITGPIDEIHIEIINVNEAIKELD